MNEKEEKPIIRSLVLETTNMCNFNCSMCVSHGKDNYKGQLDGRPKVMSFDMFKDLVDQYCIIGRPRGQGIILLQYQGEPLMTPGFLNYCAYVDSKSRLFGFTTNASLLTREISEQLLSMENFCSIAFSVDAAEEDTYKKIRVHGKLSTVKKNIEMFLSLHQQYCLEKKRKQRVNISMSYTRLPENICEYDHFLSEWLPKVDSISSSYACVFPQAAPWKMDWMPTPEERVACRSVFNTVTVLTDGKLVACCRDNYYEYDLGTIVDRTLEEAWLSKEYEALRTVQREKKWDGHPLCGVCSIWMSGPCFKETKDEKNNITKIVGPYFETSKRLNK